MELVEAARSRLQRAKAAHARVAAELGVLIAQRDSLGAEHEEAVAHNVELLGEKILRQEAVSGVNLQAKTAAEQHGRLELAGYDRAIEIKRAELPPCDAEIAAASAAVVPQVLRWTRCSQEPLLLNISEVLAQLAPVFAELTAIDLVQRSLVGERFAVPAGSLPPVSGARMSEFFVTQIPKSMCPEALNINDIERAAKARAEAILKDMK